MRCSSCHRRLGPGAACPNHPDERAPDAEAATESPPAIAGFSKLRLLGGGGFARVYAARRDHDATEVALKVGHHPDGQRFAREALALRRVGPKVAPALLGEGTLATGQPYLVLELVDGEPLSEFMARRPGNGAVPPKELLPLFSELCLAVEHMHRAGVVHRDLKPENVFLRPGGGVSLLDFGLALDEDSANGGDAGAHLTRDGERLGTAAYMAPEQCLHATAVDARADVYALGVLLFELLTGQPPFTGDPATVMQAQVAHRPPRPSQLAAALPAALDEVVLRCLGKEPSVRFASAAELASELARVLGSGMPEAKFVGAEPDARPAGQAGAAPVGAAPAVAERQLAVLGVKTRATIDVMLRHAGGGRLARVHPDCYLLVFAEPAPAASLASARRAAQKLMRALPAGDSLALHLATLRERSGGGGALAGMALERPETWWPPGAGGILVTAAAAALLEPGSLSPEERDGFRAVEPSETPHLTALPPVALHGRAELIAAVAARARSCLGSGEPALSTLLGEVGFGKTRLLRALAAELGGSTVAEAGAGAPEVVSLAAPAPESGDPSALLRSLLRVGLGLRPGEAVAAESLRHACRECLPGLGEAAWPAVAFTLDAAGEQQPEVAAMLTAPGALRQMAARAAAEGLRRRSLERPLALVIDDGQWADAASLDALESATAEPGAPLWVCVAALPALLSLRPSWGQRSVAFGVHQVERLEGAAARQLLLELLRPVEFVPEPLLARLEQMAEGVPLYLVELVHALGTGGAIRRRGESDWYLAADELLAVSPTPLAERLARRLLDSLSPPLRALAQICAVLGDEVSADELDRVQQLLAADEPAFAGALDPAVGLSRLARAGMLRRSPGAEGSGYLFRHSRLRQAIEALLPAPSRRRLHQAAFQRLVAERDRSPALLPRLARHASASGARAEAFAAHLELGEEARRRHFHVEADQHYSAALAEVDAADPARARALAGRGKVRYRIQRFHDGLVDLRAARALVEAAGDRPAVVDLLLEEAVVLDWLEDWEAASTIVERALPLATSIGDPRLDVRCDLARGRVLARRDQWDEAAELLERAADGAKALGDYEPRVIALVSLGFALVCLNRLDHAEARFEEVVGLCQRAGDAVHLAVAYNNRYFLWMKRRAFDRGMSDLREAVALARKLGNVQIERYSAINLAEFLHWSGREQEALEPARRAQDLGLRFFPDSTVPIAALLLGRILCGCSDFREARKQLDWVVAHCQIETLGADVRALHQLLRRLLAEAGEASAGALTWDELIAAAADCRSDEQVEILTGAIVSALRAGQVSDARRWLEMARAHARRAPLWHSRLGELERTVAARERDCF